MIKNHPRNHKRYPSSRDMTFVHPFSEPERLNSGTGWQRRSAYLIGLILRLQGWCLSMPKIKEDRCRLPKKFEMEAFPSFVAPLSPLCRLRMSPHGCLLEWCGDWPLYDHNMPACMQGPRLKVQRGG